MSNFPTLDEACLILEKASKLNPGPWVNHSQNVALACKVIASNCAHLDEEKAYILGLLHDIGRRVGIVGTKHMIAGYNFCIENGYEDIARICITHSFVVQNINSAIAKWDITDKELLFLKDYISSISYNDYDLLVQLCDALALPEGLCILEKRFIDVALRHGINDFTIERWRKTFEIKKYFEAFIGTSIYTILPNIEKNIYT